MNRHLSSVLAALFFMGMIVSGCETAPVPSSETVQATGLFAADARIVGRVDLERLDRQHTLPFLGEAERDQIKELVEGLGMASGDELPRIYLAVEAPFDQLRHAPTSFVIHAHVDRDQLEAYLNEHAAGEYTRSAYSDRTVYAFVRDHDHGLYMTVIDDEYIAVAHSEEALRSMVDRYEGRADGLGQETAVSELLAEVDDQGSVWILARDASSLPFADGHSDDETFRQVASVVRDVALSLDLTDERVSAQMILTTDADASDLAGLIRGGLSIARRVNTWPDEHKTLLDRITVTERRGHVLITAEAESSMLEAMAFGGTP